ncbi:MAG: ORF6N domain-containing protein [Clostridia bacterium]|nr:ORF6N domain-containing protein [Clostridia bacterium]
MEEKDIILKELNKDTIESMIYEIRGQKVMLDFELAGIYGYTTKSFNQQVQRNIDKFPVDFRFQLTKEEVVSLQRSQIVTTALWAQGAGGRGYLPYAFTEQGIYMLMTVLKGELATKQSISLIRTFKQIKDYVMSTNNLLPSYETIKLVDLIKNNSNRIDNLENQLNMVMENFIDPTTYNHFLFLDGQRLEADVAHQEIYRKAKHTIYIIDNYIDIKTLLLLKVCNPKVKITIFTDNKAKNSLTSTWIKDFINDTGLSITIKKTCRPYHDRYIYIDCKTKNEELFQCGASSKDAGNSISSIVRIETSSFYRPLIEELLKNDDLEL